MELWMDLLFGNPVGLAAVMTIGATFLIIMYIVILMVVKSRKR